MSEPGWTVRRGVRGASTVYTTYVETLAEAQALADRWTASNSQGSYWAIVEKGHAR